MGLLKDGWFLASADARHMFRRRETWLWAFVLPVVFMYFIGTITAQFNSPATGDPLTVAVPPSAGFLAEVLVSRLEKLGYEVQRDFGGDHSFLITPAFLIIPALLIIPENFTQSVLAGQKVTLEFRRKDGGILNDFDRQRLSRAAFQLSADVSALPHADAAAIAHLESEPRLLTLDVQTAGQRRTIPSGFEQAVPGSLVFFLLMILFASSGATLVAEREQGILRRLGCSPMSRGAVVLGKWGARMLLAAVQIVFAMLAGSALFHVNWGRNIPMVLCVLFFYAAMATAGGLLIGVFARTRVQAGAGGSLVANTLACVGGCWWPIEIMPRAMQEFSKFTPAGLAMTALHELVNFGSGPASVLPQVGVLALAALVLGYIAARQFRFQ
ncbi:MAG TPA: ABC transporter permease [Bryobacteraceae bacterium]|nr:ABC transporter permease [Bryobacteraceae bacterium]